MAYDPYSGMKKKVNPYGSLPPLGYAGVGRTPNGSLYGTIQGQQDPIAPPAPAQTLPGLTTPQYQALLTEAMKPYQDAYNQQHTMGLEDLNTARKRAIASFGVVPSWSKDFLSSLNASGAAPDINSVLTDEVRQLAEKNTGDGLSTTALLDKANRQANAGITNNLASRGMLQSGELGYQTNEQAQAYKQAYSEATGKLNDYLAGVAKAYADAENARNEKLLAAQETAAQSVAKRAANAGNVSLSYVAQGPNGVPIYRSADGKMFTVDAQGNRYPYEGPDPMLPAAPSPPASTSAPASAARAAAPVSAPNVYLPGNENVPARFAGAQTAMPAFAPAPAPVSAVIPPAVVQQLVQALTPQPAKKVAPASKAIPVSAANALKLALARR